VTLTGLIAASLAGSAGSGDAVDMAGTATAPPDSQLVWIFLDAAAARDSLPPALSAAALHRRLLMHIPLDMRDRPLPPALLRALERAGARVRVRSRWLRAVSAWVAPSALGRIGVLPFVRGIRPVAQLRVTDGGNGRSRGTSAIVRAPYGLRDRGAAARRPVGGAGRAVDRGRPAGTGCTAQTQPNFGTPEGYGSLYAALLQMRVPQVHALGFTGHGVEIAILDQGFDPDHDALAPLPVMAAHDFVNNDDDVADQPGDVTTPQDPAVHGTATWSLLAACEPGTMLGPAFNATFDLAKVDDANSETHLDEDRWVAGLEWADSVGARIASSSLAYRAFDDGSSYSFAQLDGNTLPSTRAAREAARRGVLVVNAMGNGGPGGGTLMAPADADSIIAVGAVDSTGAVYVQSSRGPTSNGRTKPELSARGVDMTVASPAGPNAFDAHVSGTSYATPLIAGAAALVMEAWPDLSAMGVRSALLMAGSRARAPDNAVGAGVPDVLAAVSFPGGIAPFPVQGVDVTGAFTTLSPLFRWNVPLVHPTARPVRYFLELARDSLFAEIAYRDSIGDAFALAVRRAIRPTPAVWWRVVASAANGATLVGPTAGPLSVPDWVRLNNLNSTSGNYVASPRPVFSWHALPAPAPAGPLRFEVDVLDATSLGVVRSMTGLADTTASPTEPLDYNVPYRWRVIASAADATADTVESVAPFVVVSETRPPSTQLYQNFPNPFPAAGAPDGSTQFWFDISESSSVRLAIYDLHGRLVRRLIPRQGCSAVTLEPGLYGRNRSGEEDPCVLTHWDGLDDAGRQVVAGVYFARLQAAGVTRSVRILFLPR
jgi:Subtilase family